MMEPATRGGIFSEQVRHLYRLSRPAYLATLVNAGIVAFVLWDIVSRTLLAAWGAALVIVIAARYALYRAYVRASQPAEQAQAWATRFIIGAAVTGLLWGVAG